MFSRREKTLLALAAVAVAVAAGVQLSGGAGGNARADYAREAARWQELRQRVQEAEARLADLTAPEAEVSARMLRTAQASGAATGVTISSARPRRPTKTSSGCLEHTLELQVSGGFPSITRFMFDIEAANPNLRIARVSLTASDSESDRVNCAIIIAGYSPGENDQ